ncbi:hmu, partial [Symbiodinium necroappetens]
MRASEDHDCLEEFSFMCDDAIEKAFEVLAPLCAQFGLKPPVTSKFKAAFLWCNYEHGIFGAAAKKKEIEELQDIIRLTLIAEGGDIPPEGGEASGSTGPEGESGQQDEEGAENAGEEDGHETAQQEEGDESAQQEEEDESAQQEEGDESAQQEEGDEGAQQDEGMDDSGQVQEEDPETPAASAEEDEEIDEEAPTVQKKPAARTSDKDRVCRDLRIDLIRRRLHHPEMGVVADAAVVAVVAVDRVAEELGPRGPRQGVRLHALDYVAVTSHRSLGRDIDVLDMFAGWCGVFWGARGKQGLRPAYYEKKKNRSHDLATPTWLQQLAEAQTLDPVKRKQGGFCSMGVVTRKRRQDGTTAVPLSSRTGGPRLSGTESYPARFCRRIMHFHKCMSEDIGYVPTVPTVEDFELVDESLWSPADLATKEDENEADEEQEEVEEEKVAEVPTAELDGKEEVQAPATLPEEATPMSVEKEAAPVDEPKEEDQKDSAPEPTKASIPLEEEEPAPKDEALEEPDGGRQGTLFDAMPETK